jgi:hypothetical protein
MTLQVFLLLFFLMLSLAQLCHLYWTHHGLPHSKAVALHTAVHRLLKPRSPRDCPTCTLSSVVESAPQPVRPWHEVKSRRGAPKRVNTDGFACPNHQCPYFGITDAYIHAPLWGWHTWPCRADPDVSLSGLPHHVQCSTPHSLVPSENPLSPDRHGANCARRRAGPFRRRACLRLPSGHHHEPFCRALASTLRPYTSAPFASSSSHTSN